MLYRCCCTKYQHNCDLAVEIYNLTGQFVSKYKEFRKDPVHVTKWLMSSINHQIKRNCCIRPCISLCLSELLRSCWNVSGGNLVHERGVCSHCGQIFFMSETDHTCSCLCHPLFSRQKIPKKSHSRSFYLADSASDHSKCLSMSTAMCRTSSTATRCPVWLPRY